MKEENGKLNLISEKRRRLLKAAASTAPVVATLQSGAAFAAASAFNCIDSTRFTTQVDAGDVDKYVYAEATRTVYIHNGNGDLNELNNFYDQYVKE